MNQEGTGTRGRQYEEHTKLWTGGREGGSGGGGVRKGGRGEGGRK